jgi:hypothetical protein
VSESVPERPRANLVAALNVRRNAAIGFGVGALVAALLYAYRVGVVGSVQGQAGTPLSFLALAFVLALALGALVTALLTVVTALGLARDLE